jgi:hypothetical protein
MALSLAQSVWSTLKQGFGGGRCEWRLDPPRLERPAGRYRVVMEWAGAPIWFESNSEPLTPAPESLASIALIPALRSNARIDSSLTLDPEWLANSKTLAETFAQWWNYATDRIELGSPSLALTDPPQERHTGLFFTGGVDSLHSLLRSSEPIQRLVFVHGFDVPLSDHRRAADISSMLREVAAATNTQPIFLATNLREHPLFSRASWEHTHGAALFAVGHLLSHSLNRVVIASSFSRACEHPWGSHWRTDPLWSTRLLRIVHDAPDLARWDKVEQIARERLVQKHLRVCWQNSSKTGNCSRCEKCLRTMSLLAIHGNLDQYETFDRSVPLPNAIDRLPSIPRRLIPRWQLIGERQPSANTRQAIDRLIQRSQPSRLQATPE